MSEVQHFCGGGVIGCRCAEYAKLTEQIDGEARKQLEAFWKTQMDLQQTDKKDVWVIGFNEDGSVMFLSRVEAWMFDLLDEYDFRASNTIYFYAELS